MAVHRTSRRWLRPVLAVATLVAGLLLAVTVAGASDGQPPPGAPATVGEDAPLVAQPPAAATSSPGASAELGSQPANPHPDADGPPTQVVGPESEGSGRPSEAGEVETAVVGRPD